LSAKLESVLPSEIYNQTFNTSLTILIGGHGSGKSEFAIVWSRRLIKAGHKHVTLVDLDTIKPLFRSQEAKSALMREGIEVVISSIPHSDMPSISPTMYGEISDISKWIVVDVGGDAIGARILASLRNNLQGRVHNLIYITNASRPFNFDVTSCTRELKRIENTSGLKITALVSNTHMLDETTPEIIQRGIEITDEISSNLGIPFLGVMVEEKIAQNLTIPDDIELFVMRRMLNPYWLREY
jgi:hypothetical protein